MVIMSGYLVLTIRLREKYWIRYVVAHLPNSIPSVAYTKLHRSELLTMKSTKDVLTLK